MIKYAIVIKPAGDYWFDDWKFEVSEDFDENVVIIGQEENASWWIDAKYIIEGIDNYDEMEDFISDNQHTCSRHKLSDIGKLYQSWDGYSDDTEFIAEVAKILYPFMNIEVGSLDAYRESNECVYIANEVDASVLQDWWAGDVYAVSAYELDTELMEEDEVDISDLDSNNVEDYGSETEDGSFPLTDTDYWKMRNSDSLLANLAQAFGYPKEECILIDD